MNRTITSAAAIIAVLVSVGAANAAEANNRGVYLSVGAGMSHLQDADLEDSGVTGTAEFDKGLYLSGALGHHVAPNFRVEGEFTYRRNSFDNINITGIGALDTNGNASAYSLMANAYYDFNNSSGVTPYIGAGLGATHIRLNDVSVVGITLSDSHDTVFSYQGIAGLAVGIAPNTNLSLEYKYLGTSDPTFDGTKAEYRNHAIGVKLGFDF